MGWSTASRPPKCLLTPCGNTLTWTGLAALTLVSLLRALCLCYTVALSSAEAEFISASTVVQEVIYFCKFMANLGYPQTASTAVFADNETCTAWSKCSDGSIERAKHIDLRVHFVHEACAAGLLETLQTQQQSQRS